MIDADGSGVMTGVDPAMARSRSATASHTPSRDQRTRVGVNGREGRVHLRQRPPRQPVDATHNTAFTMSRFECFAGRPIRR